MKVNKILILFLLLLLPITVFADTSNLKEEYQLELYKAKVLEVIDSISLENTEIQTLKILIRNKDYKGEESIIKNTLTGNNYDIKLKEGDKITVILQENNDGDPSFYFHNYDKTNHLIVLITIFSLSVIILGGMKGIKALLSLICTIFLILVVLVPLLLKGYNPIILSILTCIISTIVTFLITNGFTKKTLIAIIGVSGGLLIGGLIAYVFGILAKITGFSSENAQMLQYLPGNISFDFKGLLFAGIIIGALGACMDVAMEITSSLMEIKKHNPKISNKEIIISGFNIGKDIMGTMVNTLILAYTGGSLSTILIFTGFEKSLSEVINLDSIATEIIRAISGSMGLLFSIPITIIAFIYITKDRKGYNEKNN